MDRLVIRTLLPLVALVFGTAALGSELDDGTAVYLLAKPIARWRIVAAKVIVAAGLAAAVTAPAAFIAGSSWVERVAPPLPSAGPWAPPWPPRCMPSSSSR